MRLELLPLDPAEYRAHALHTGDVDWTETNCATDMWIEVLHAWGLDPVAGLAFTVGTDFDGEQWTMFTYPDEDLRLLYGIEANELNVWRPVVEHLDDQLRLGHLVSVDVDAYHLPDTRGVTYQLAHQKTTIGVQMLDRQRRVLGYFHNAGYAELSGEDFDALLHLGPFEDPMAVAMPPFATLVRLEELRVDPADLLDLVLERLRTHLGRRPLDNPVARLAKRMVEDLPRIASDGMDAYHRYAFGSCRHLGANAELAAAFTVWLATHDPGAAALAEVADHFRTISTGAKAAELILARAARGRTVDLPSVLDPLAVGWDQALSALDARYGG